MMHKLLKLEEFGMFALGVLLFTYLDFSWWIFPALLLTPDISMIGYSFNTKIGAGMYNLFHHRGFAAGIYIVGIIASQPILQLTGIILFSHSSLDRIFGYGLKFTDSFKHTHLGWIGRNDNY